jgi:hypothetical protein
VQQFGRFLGYSGQEMLEVSLSQVTDSDASSSLAATSGQGKIREASGGCIDRREVDEVRAVHEV